MPRSDGSSAIASTASTAASSPGPPGSTRTAPLALAAVLLFLLGGWAPAAPAQERAGADTGHPTEIVLLGTTHFANVATDSAALGILSEERQRELDAVSNLIAEWGPEHFLVECSPDEQAALDSAYRAYRRGAYDLTDPPGRVGRGEIHQLGFRTAAAAGLDGVDCVDAEVVTPWTRTHGVAKEHNPGLYAEYRDFVEERKARESVLADRTVRQALLVLNRDSMLYNEGYLYYHPRMGSFDGAGARVRRESELAGSTFAAPFELAERHMQELREAIESVDGKFVEDVVPEADYVVLLDPDAAAAESGPGTGADTVSVDELSEMIDRTSTTWVGFPEHHIGADLVAQWYKRNLRIYANIWRAAEGDDRVILLMGQNHVWPLMQFFRGNPDFRVVPVDEVL